MAKHSLDRKAAVNASGQSRSTAYRTMRGAELGSPASLFTDLENVDPALLGHRIEYEGSDEWFLTADSLLYLHSESSDEEASFAEDCHVSAECEQKLLANLDQIAKKRIGKKFQLGKDQKRRFPGRPKQERKLTAMNRVAMALDQLASKRPEQVRKAIESYCSLVQADDRLILTKERNEGDLRRVIWLVRNLRLPLLNLQFLGFSTEESPQAGRPIVFNVKNRSSRHQATLRQMQRQFRRLKVPMPEPFLCVRPKNATSEGVLEQIAIEVQWNEHACRTFRYVMAVAAISRFWETYQRQPTAHLENPQLVGLGQELEQKDKAVIVDDEILSYTGRANSPDGSHVVVMRFWQDDSSPMWKACFYEDDTESKLLREWVFPQVKKLIETAAKGGVPEASMLPFTKAGGRAVKLMLNRQQYQSLKAGQHKDGEQTHGRQSTG